MTAPNRHDWENDPVWRLLDQAPPPEPGPLFVRNVLREVRLAEAACRPWWQGLLAPKPLAAGALGAAALAALVIWTSPTPQTAETPEPEPAATNPVEALLEEELLLTAAEDPSVFSDEQLVALLY